MIKKKKIENETYYINRNYKKKNQKCVIVIVFFDYATWININHLNQILHVRKNVLYVKKSIVDSSIIHFKKEMIQSKNLKTNIFNYESNQILTKIYSTESSNMKIKISMK